MEGSRTPLHKWAVAIRLISRTDVGTTAVELQAVIQVSYKTAWLMLHRVRQALSQAEQSDPLSGTVKSIMKYYTDPFYATYDASLLKSPVIIAAGVDAHNTPLQFKFKHIPADQIIRTNHVRSWGVSAFISQYVQPDAEFHPIATPIHHKRTPLILNEYRKSRRWLNTTFHGIGPKYIQAYLHEYAFRINHALRGEPIEHHMLSACARYAKLPLDHCSPQQEYMKYVPTREQYFKIA